MPITKIIAHAKNRMIWRLFTTDDGCLLIEEREAADRRVVFSCLNFRSGKYLFEDLSLEEKYWAGIEAIHNGIICFHGYAQPDMPVHKGIFAYDIKSARMLWKRDDLTFFFALNNDIYCYSQMFEGKEFFILDSITGEKKKGLGENHTEVNQLKAEADILNAQTDLLFPVTGAGEDDETRETVSGYLSMLGIEGVAEYIITDSYFFCAVNVPSSGGYNTEFLVLARKAGKVVLHEKINKEIRLLAIDNFFIKGNHLFLLREKQVIEVYHLN
ncbi:MAG: DUF4905 domain-containing protein [Ignavibacteriaceae bacterium]|nr:DUF4905 domain-containing protein [Ignavibacteriaceae bacterium]